MTTTRTPTEHRSLGDVLCRWTDTGAAWCECSIDTVEPGQFLVGNAGGELAGRLDFGALDEVAVPLARADRWRGGCGWQ